MFSKILRADFARNRHGRYTCTPNRWPQNGELTATTSALHYSLLSTKNQLKVNGSLHGPTHVRVSRCLRVMWLARCTAINQPWAVTLSIDHHHRRVCPSVCRTKLSIIVQFFVSLNIYAESRPWHATVQYPSGSFLKAASQLLRRKGGHRR